MPRPGGVVNNDGTNRLLMFDGAIVQRGRCVDWLSQRLETTTGVAPHPAILESGDNV
jgi:hypothetical protein